MALPMLLMPMSSAEASVQPVMARYRPAMAGTVMRARAGGGLRQAIPSSTGRGPTSARG